MLERTIDNCGSKQKGLTHFFLWEKNLGFAFTVGHNESNRRSGGKKKNYLGRSVSVEKCFAYLRTLSLVPASQKLSSQDQGSHYLIPKAKFN